MIGCETEICKGSWLRNLQNQRERENAKKANADEEATAEEEREAPVLLVTQVNTVLHTIFSNVEFYIKNQQVYNSNGLYEHNYYTSNNFKKDTSENKVVLHCGWYDYEEVRVEIMEAVLSEISFTMRRKMLSGPGGFMLYLNWG